MTRPSIILIACGRIVYGPLFIDFRCVPVWCKFDLLLDTFSSLVHECIIDYRFLPCTFSGRRVSDENHAAIFHLSRSVISSECHVPTFIIWKLLTCFMPSSDGKRGFYIAAQPPWKANVCIFTFLVLDIYDWALESLWLAHQNTRLLKCRETVLIEPLH